MSIMPKIDEKMFGPIKTLFDMKRGSFKPSGRVIQRSLRDMDGMYLDENAYNEMVQRGDPIIYDIYEADVPLNEEGALAYCSNIVHPGRVGDEYFMTKGHYHSNDDAVEVYFCTAGEGILLMQTRKGEVTSIEMEPGVIAYIPPRWAHRTVNVGDEDLVFLAVYPADSGHDYGSIERSGFIKLVVEREGKPTIIDNPRFSS